ncbi:hypothetical protein OGAPHI_000752 [Ogataea philodendri]|uniref:Enhancer of translation termination 1 n=1 Tax=Ogataea philodendri TaxID=1378263 RepID=A0A9P8T9M8_9ASCO|nr:uncharacterized protein OGAPHI_000752 [Ogataea philodendri]KAH3671041.1 hypothetical protein OGAPHI_000752 [Ogataea philodendri]
MGPKRPQGFGKKAKAKKQKVDEVVEEVPVTNELTVELPAEVDSNDPVTQLEGLWLTWLKSDKDNELILNGIVHECDRLLRNCKQNGGNEDIELGASFYAIYGLSLAGLAQFNTEESETGVKEYFENAIERIENGMDKFPGEEGLILAKSQIILDRIPLEYISQMDQDSHSKDFPDVGELLEEATRLLEVGIKNAETKENYAIFNGSTILSVLDSFDDLLDIIANFGRDYNEGLDSDAEESDEEDNDGQNELSTTHPLFKVQNNDQYQMNLRDTIAKSLELARKNEQPDESVQRRYRKKLGELLLLEAEEPISIYTALEFGSDEEESGVGEEQAKKSKKAQKKAQKLVGQAIEHLTAAWDEEEPQSWVDLAEAEISMGNLFAEEGEQEKWYGLAEKKLVRANNASHGKYEEVLSNLRGTK